MAVIDAGSDYSAAAAANIALKKQKKRRKRLEIGEWKLPSTALLRCAALYEYFQLIDVATAKWRWR